MKKINLALLGITTFLLLSFVLSTKTNAQQNNPIFATVQQVRQMIDKALDPIQTRVRVLDRRVTKLEVAVDNLSEPQCATCTAEVAVKAVNEEVAIDSLLSIYLAQQEFQKNDTDEDGLFDYAEQLSLLFESGRLIDNVLATGEKRGYTYEVKIDPNQNFWFATAAPKKKGKTGDRSFYIDESGVIRFNASASAGVADEPIGG